MANLRFCFDPHETDPLDTDTEGDEVIDGTDPLGGADNLGSSGTRGGSCSTAPGGAASALSHALGRPARDLAPSAGRR